MLVLVGCADVVSVVLVYLFVDVSAACVPRTVHGGKGALVALRTSCLVVLLLFVPPFTFVVVAC